MRFELQNLSLFELYTDSQVSQYIIVEVGCICLFSSKMNRFPLFPDFFPSYFLHQRLRSALTRVASSGLASLSHASHLADSLSTLDGLSRACGEGRKSDSELSVQQSHWSRPWLDHHQEQRRNSVVGPLSCTKDCVNIFHVHDLITQLLGNSAWRLMSHP